MPVKDINKDTIIDIVKDVMGEEDIPITGRLIGGDGRYLLGGDGRNLKGGDQ